MTLIDSSAWIEYLRATGSPTHERVRELVASEAELATTEPVSMELLAGARDPAQRRRLRAMLAACRLLPVSGLRDWEDAAALYLSCRAAGATPRRLLDCLIAVVAISAGTPVLAHDRDFEAIAAHTALELAG